MTSASKRPFSQNMATIVKVTNERVMTPNAATATTQRIASTNRHFSSCNSTAKSSTRFCAVASSVSHTRFNEVQTPGFVSVAFVMRSLSGDEHADEQADA